MKTKILTLLLVQFMALSAFAGNVITYTASEKLPETTTTGLSGLHTNAFNVAISSHTFSNGTGTITFKGDVTSIGCYAFYKCSGLTSVTIPNSVTIINSYAFEYCSGLTSITIPNSVTIIGVDAFYECSGLTSITIPNSVTSIGESAFRRCSGLTSITIPNSVTSIGDRAFSYSGLTSVLIGNSVTSIGLSAFEYCPLTSIIWNVIEFPSPTSDSEAPFYRNRYYNNITSFIIGDDVLTIPAYLCDGMNKLTAISIPESVTNIGNYAFSNCTSLTDIHMESELPASFSSNAFPKSVTIHVPCQTKTAYQTQCNAYSYVEPLPDYEIDVKINSNQGSIYWIKRNSCTNIVEFAAEPYIGYSFVQWSDGVTDNPRTVELTQDSTFTAEIVMDYEGACGDNLTWKFSKGVLSISGIGDMYGFSYSSTPWKNFRDSITKVVLPDGLTRIGNYAFYNCKGVASIVIPNTVINIGYDAFYGCTALTSIVIPNCVENIGEYAFEGCSGLTSITIPNSVTSIGNNAFYDCSGVTELTIGSLVSSIGKSAFYGCKRLVTITCFATNPPTAYGNSFQYYDCDLYVPCDELRTYKRDEVFGQFENIECIGAESGETVTDVVTTPSDNTVTILWPKDDAASTYTIVITKDGITICTLTFNAAGQLMNIAFAPGRDTEMPSHAAESINGSWSFTVTGLNSGTKYEYSVTTKNSAQSVLSSYSGSFTTTGLVPTSLDNTSIEMQTTKFFRDGQLHIIRDEKIYTVEGVLVE